MKTCNCHNRDIARDWFATSFGALYPILYAHRTLEAAAPECAFALQQLNIRPETFLLDICCGNGRHLVHLAKQATRAVGVDFSPELLNIARNTVGAHVRLVRADLRALPFHDAFDAAFSFFTSFGYFQSEEENSAAAQSMIRVLKPGGKFFMDYFNAAYVETHLCPYSERVQQGYCIQEERWIDPGAQRVNKITTVFHGDKHVARLGESVAMYSLDALCGLFHRAGLEIDRVFGDYEGQAFDSTQPRMILVGHRTA